jgi:type II secretion system protein L
MKRKILGLDIRNDAVSAVLLSGSAKKAVIEAHEFVPISEPEDFASALAAALETIAAKLEVSGAACAASFPADRVSYRNIQVPFKEPKKIKQILPYELEPTLPVAVDDLMIDYQKITLPNREDHTDLVAVAVEKTELQSYLDTLALFDIQPETVTVGGYPAALCLARLSDSPEHLLFADIDNQNVSVFAVLSGEMCLIRSFPIRSEKASSAGEPIGIDIRHTWSALEEQLGFDFQPDTLVISGSSWFGPDFEKDLSQTVGLAVRQTDFLSHTEITLSPQSETPWQPHQMNSALTLAIMESERMNGFNFRKGPFAARKFWVEHKKYLLTTGIIAGLVIFLGFASVGLDSYLLSKEVARIDQQITDVFSTTFPDVKKIVDPYQQMLVKIKAARKKAALTAESGQHIRTIDILNDISRLIPRKTDVHLTRLVVGSESLMISGHTDNFNAVDDIKIRLEKSPLFKKITINSANIDRSDNRVRFKLKVNL